MVDEAEEDEALGCGPRSERTKRVRVPSFTPTRLTMRLFKALLYFSPMIALVLSALTVACDSAYECRKKAKVLGVDEKLCESFDNREMIQAEFNRFGREQIKNRTPKTTCDKETVELTEKIKKLEAELLNCEERLEGASGMGCDIPANMPPPPECDCEMWKR